MHGPGDPLIAGQAASILPPGRAGRASTHDHARVPDDRSTTRAILDDAAIASIIERLAETIDRTVPRDGALILIGIQRRGDVIARRLAAALAPARGEVPTGSLDITLYRDDFGQIGSLPLIGTTDIRADITNAHVIIVDDVLYTGRTIRAAINELYDFGRASKIELCVLVDRGGRQLPIQPDYVGESVDVPEAQQVSVRVDELDEAWGVDLVDPASGETAP